MLSLLLLSCEKPPVEPIIRAEKTLQEARNGKAHLYAARLYEKAEKALMQSKYFVKVKKYKEAADSAALATLYARQSIGLVPAGREEYKVRSMTVVTGMEDKLSELGRSVEKTTNKRMKKKMENFYGPFVTKWGLQIELLKTQLEKEEPYDAFNLIENNRILFENELKDIEASIQRKKAKS
jgi:hypothetical protein